MTSEQEFIDRYVTTFLATYAAVTYDENCQRGKPAQHPVEDAFFLAREAWNEVKAKGE
jgi:hypothetical protein